MIKRLPSFFLMLLGLSVFPGVAALPAAAQQRLGLVIGVSEFGETRHPTAVPDAALVSQSLKSSGFNVTEAANLGQGPMREAIREFIAKAQGAGQDAIIAVYLSGLGMQDESENYMLPARPRLSSRGDLAIEGFRLSDLLRPLAALPATNKIALMDLGYQSPLTSTLGEGARGLALIEAQQGLLVSYNTSPGALSPLPTTNYGHYAMALAEVLREPGLPMEAMMERLRLRVHDLSKGAETPWQVSGLVPGLVLTASLGTAQALPAIVRRPMRDLDSEEAYARAVELDTIAGYDEFLKLHPKHDQAPRIRALMAQRREAATWARTRKANSEQAYWTYLKRYPRGQHSGEARQRLARLTPRALPPENFVEYDYDDLMPPDMDEMAAYETVVIDDRWERLPVHGGRPMPYLPPPPIEIIELEPPPRYSPGMMLLPAIPLAIGAAVLANRMWSRPKPVRPAYLPPPPPPRPYVPPGGFVRPGTGGPALAPLVPPAPNQVRPGAIPQPQRPVAVPSPQLVAPVQNPPPRMVAPVAPPPVAVPLRPGVQPPGVATPPRPTVQPPMIATPPQTGLRPPVSTTPGRPSVPTITAPVQPRPPVANAPQPQRPMITPANPRQPVAPARPTVRPGGHVTPSTRAAPSYRPPPPVYRPPVAPAPSRAAPPQQQRMVAPVQQRAAPPPPPRMIAPAPQQPRMMAPPPPRAAPPPARPAPAACTPQMRAQRQC